LGHFTRPAKMNAIFPLNSHDCGLHRFAPLYAMIPTRAWEKLPRTQKNLTPTCSVKMAAFLAPHVCMCVAECVRWLDSAPLGCELTLRSFHPDGFYPCSRTSPFEVCQGLPP
jgi:hypothetical protein